MGLEPGTGAGPMRSARGPSSRTALRVAGALLLLGGVTVLMGIVTAEALYPGTYTTGANEISELGGRGGRDGFPSSAAIFTASIVATGLLTLAAGILLGRAGAGALLGATVALIGIGLVGVGLLPSGTGWPHLVSALGVFAAGGAAAIASARVTEPPFRYIALVMGLVSLGILVGYAAVRGDAPLPGLGVGGLERWVAYPILLWSVGFGGYLMGGGILRTGGGQAVVDEPGPSSPTGSDR